MVKHARRMTVGVSGFKSRVGGAYQLRICCADPGTHHAREKRDLLSASLYQMHYGNERELTDAFEIASLACKDAIRTANEYSEKLLTKNCALLLAAKLETTLMRIIYEPSGFHPDRRGRILAASTAEERWLAVIKEDFAKRHGIPVRYVPERLPFTARARYDGIEQLVQDQFSPLIELRNSLAHGQWYRTFDSTGTKINQNRMAQMARQSLWRLTIQSNLLQHVSALIYDLVVTRYAFERDFDKHWGNLRSAAKRLEVGSSEKWVQMLRDRHKRRWQYTPSTP
jgi:hypothetical protein